MKRITSVSALALCAFAAPAFADVTPQQVWDDLANYMGTFGYAVDGQQSISGGDLTVSDATMSINIPDAGGVMSVGLGTMTFSDRGDGTVGVSLPATMPMSFNFDADGEQVNVVVDVTYKGLDMVVSGDETEMTYAYSAQQMGLTLAELNVDGEQITRDMARFDMVMGPVKGGSVTRTEGNLRAVAQDASFGDVTYNFAANQPDGNEGGVFSGTIAGLTVSGKSTIPTDLDMTDIAGAMAAGLAGGGEYRHQGGTLEFAVTDNKGTTSGQSSSGSGYLAVDMSDGALRYAIGGTDLQVALSGPEIPLPINFGMAESRFDITMPLVASDEPQESALGLTLGGVTVSELIWNMFDPGAVLPRDPATISMDLIAQVTPFVSLLDTKAMENLGDNAPGELNAVTLEKLEISAAGGKITGDGAFTFDNTDLASFDGMPRPEGKLNMQVSGANGLIDALIQMGLVAEQDAMGARMMLSMFTVPGNAPDTATSTIEVNADGHVLANGQRIK